MNKVISAMLTSQGVDHEVVGGEIVVGAKKISQAEYLALVKKAEVNNAKYADSIDDALYALVTPLDELAKKLSKKNPLAAVLLQKYGIDAIRELDIDSSDYAKIKKEVAKLNKANSEVDTSAKKPKVAPKGTPEEDIVEELRKNNKFLSGTFEKGLTHAALKGPWAIRKVGFKKAKDVVTVTVYPNTTFATFKATKKEFDISDIKGIAKFVKSFESKKEFK